MSFRHNRLAREGFAHTLENGGELNTIPSELNETIDESVNLSSETTKVNIDNEIVSDVTDVATADLGTLENLEESLEDESREVSEEEAEAVKLVTENFANRYGFDIPRSLATESFGTNRKRNREIALKHVRHAKLGTESFIVRMVDAAVEGVVKSIDLIVGQPKALRKMAILLRSTTTTNKNIGDVYGQSLFKTAGRNLVLGGEFIGDDLPKLRKVMEANTNYDMASVVFKPSIIDDIVEKAKNGELDANADAVAIARAIPEIGRYADEINKQFEEIGMKSNGEIELLGGRLARLTKMQTLNQVLIYLFFNGRMALALPIIIGNMNDNMKISGQIPAIQPSELSDYADLLEDLATTIDNSSFLGRGKKGIFKTNMSVKKDQAMNTIADLDEPVKNVVKGVLLAEERAILAQIKLRVENISALVSGLVDYVRQSLSAYK